MPKKKTRSFTQYVWDIIRKAKTIVEEDGTIFLVDTSGQEAKLVKIATIYPENLTKNVFKTDVEN